MKSILESSLLHACLLTDRYGRKRGGDSIRLLRRSHMPKLEVTDRTIGFFKKNLETMPQKKRIEYQNQKLRGIVQYAYKNSVAFKSKMDSAGLKPKDIQTVRDLEKIPITKKAELMELQRKTPPFGGFEGV